MPPPDALEAFGRIDPTLPTRLMAMVEEEAKHQRALDMQQAKLIVEDQAAARSERRLGQWLGFGIAVLALLVAGYVATNGSPVVGGIIGTVDLVALVSIFVIGRRMNQKADAPPTERPSTH